MLAALQSWCFELNANTRMLTCSNVNIYHECIPCNMFIMIQLQQYAIMLWIRSKTTAEADGKAICLTGDKLKLEGLQMVQIAGMTTYYYICPKGVSVHPEGIIYNSSTSVSVANRLAGVCLVAHPLASKMCCWKLIRMSSRRTLRRKDAVPVTSLNNVKVHRWHWMMEWESRLTGDWKWRHTYSNNWNASWSSTWKRPPSYGGTNERWQLVPTLPSTHSPESPPMKCEIFDLAKE